MPRFRFALLTVVVTFTVLLAAPLECQSNPGEEAWVLLEKAKALSADRENPDLGEALRLLRKAIAGQQAFFPEAEIAIAEIYFQEGALELARAQLERVLLPENRSLLRVREDGYAALYRLAQIAEIQERYTDMQKVLEQILQDHDAYAKPAAQRFRSAFLAAYLGRGLDQALRLYRLEQAGFTLEAQAKLGWFTYRTGRYEPASIQHSLFALDIMVTEAVQEIRQAFPAYEFKTLDGFLLVAQQEANVREYLTASGFFRVAFYLADATFAAGHPARAAEIWKVLADGRWDPDLAGPYAALAGRQLRAPRVEPYINPSTRELEYPTD